MNAERRQGKLAESFNELDEMARNGESINNNTDVEVVTGENIARPPSNPPKVSLTQSLEFIAQSQDYKMLFEHRGRPAPFSNILESIRNRQVWDENAWPRAQGILHNMVPGYQETQQTIFDREIVKKIFWATRRAFMFQEDPYRRPRPSAAEVWNKYDNEMTKALEQVKDLETRSIYMTFASVMFERGMFKGLKARPSETTQR